MNSSASLPHLLALHRSSPPPLSAPAPPTPTHPPTPRRWLGHAPAGLHGRTVYWTLDGPLRPCATNMIPNITRSKTSQIPLTNTLFAVHTPLLKPDTPRRASVTRLSSVRFPYSLPSHPQHHLPPSHCGRSAKPCFSITPPFPLPFLGTAQPPLPPCAPLRMLFEASQCFLRPVRF
jgi:hypothetical protein